LDLLQQFPDSNPPDPIDDFLSYIDLWRPIEDGLTAPLTAVVQVALKSLMVVYRVCPDIVCAFVIARDVLLVRLLQAPDLVLPSLTLLLLALDADPAFASWLAVRRRLVRRLSAIVGNTSDVILTSAVLTMVSELTAESTLLSSPTPTAAAHFSLRTWGPAWPRGPRSSSPRCASGARWSPRSGTSPSAPSSTEYCSLSATGDQTEFTSKRSGSGTASSATSRPTSRATQLLDALLCQLTRGPRLKVLFLMTNMCANSEIAAYFIGTPTLERTWRRFDMLTCAEKENFLIMIAQICVNRPVEAFPRCKDFIETAFDFTHSARRAELPMYFLMALANLAREDQARETDVNFAAIIDGLADLAPNCESEAVAAAAQEILNAYDC
jgi:hypothetical protein